MGILHFGLVGDFQSGKSTLINCLLGCPIAKVGEGVSTTHSIINYRYSEFEHIELINDIGQREHIVSTDLNGIDNRKDIKEVDVFLKNNFLKATILTDMPGFGFDEKDNQMSEGFIHNLDYAIVVMTNYKAIEEESSYFKNIQILKKNNIPYYIILNCSDSSSEKWLPSHSDNLNIAKRDAECIKFYKPLKYPFDDIIMPIVNLMWYWFAIMGDQDGEVCRYLNAFRDYGLLDSDVKNTEIIEASNYNLINKIFEMDNRAYLELRKDFKEEIKKMKDEICPIGTIQTFAYSNPPDGWLMCDGAKLSISKYQKLFEVIGNVFGGDGEKDFCIPNLKGQFIRGWDDRDDTRKFGSSQGHAIQGHTHEFVPERLSVKISANGEHTHTIRARKTKAQDTSMFSSDIDVLKWLYVDGDDSADSSTNGSHCHAASVGIKDNPVGNITDSNYGEVEKNCHETRPTNVNLMFCIRVE